MCLAKNNKKQYKYIYIYILKSNKNKETVEMWRLCKAGLFFLRRITADPSPSGKFTPPTKQ